MGRVSVPPSVSLACGFGLRCSLRGGSKDPRFGRWTKRGLPWPAPGVGAVIILTQHRVTLGRHRPHPSETSGFCRFWDKLVARIELFPCCFDETTRCWQLLLWIRTTRWELGRFGPTLGQALPGCDELWRDFDVVGPWLGRCWSCSGRSLSGMCQSWGCYRPFWRRLRPLWARTWIRTRRR